MNAVQIVIALIVAVCIAGVGAVWAYQRHMVYRFSTDAATPEEVGLPGARVVTLASEDGQEIRAWIVPPRDGAPVILSFFGNFTSVGPSAVRMLPLLDRGYGMAMLVYRGSGGAPGTPSEAGFAADARALYDGLDGLMSDGIPPRRRVIHGYSLGTGVAVGLAAEREAAGLVLEAGFDRLCRFQEARTKGLPMCRLMWTERHDVIDRIGAIPMPVLFAHGGRDAAIPIAWAKALFAAAPEPKRFVTYPEGTHTDLMQSGLAEEMDGFIADVTAD